jgi:hypothetical protein
MMVGLSPGVITPEELSARMQRLGFRLAGTARAYGLLSGRICTTLTLDSVADLGLRSRAREAALSIAGVEWVRVDPGLPRRLYLLHW